MLRRVPLWRIAEIEKVHKGQITRDLQHLRRQWLRESEEDTNELRAQELAVLDELEYDCVIRFDKTKDVEWMNTRLRAMQRRAKMMGLDDPELIGVVGPGGGPVQVEHSAADRARQVVEDPELLELSRQMRKRRDVLDAVRDGSDN